MFEYLLTSIIVVITWYNHLILKESIILHRIEGTIIWYSVDKQHAIIRQKLNRKTISIHQSQIHFNSLKDIGKLSIGQKVSFVINNSIAENLYFL